MDANGPARSTGREVAQILVIAAAVFAGIVAGFWLDRPNEVMPSPVFVGVVDSLDPEGVCVERSGEVECFSAAGVGVEPGDTIRYRVIDTPIDPDDGSKGTHKVLFDAHVR